MPEEDNPERKKRDRQLTWYEVAGAKPTTIIRTDQHWGVKAHWELEGPLKAFICGEWCLER